MEKIIVQQYWPGDHAGYWQEVGKATTWDGAERIAKREDNPDWFGGTRHPSGGPRYGTIRALQGDKVKLWDRNIGFIDID